MLPREELCILMFLTLDLLLGPPARGPCLPFLPFFFCSVFLSLFIFLLFFSVLPGSFGFGFILFWHCVFEIGSRVLQAGPKLAI